jgi:hypothetical protein
MYMGGVYQLACQFLVCRNDDAIFRANTQRGSTVRHSIQCVFNLQQFTRSGKGSQRETVGGISHGVYNSMYRWMGLRRDDSGHNKG